MSPLTDAHQHTLLRLARLSLEESVRTGRPAEPRTLDETSLPHEPLLEACGAFVTLRKQGQLRGCIGNIETSDPLYVTVQHMAFAAALCDYRFTPVQPDELPFVSIEISVLSPLADIRPAQVEVGRHGLMVSFQGCRGLLLPQVPIEWNWDRDKFLDETCHKAGLPRDAWRHGARIQAFTAQVLAEPLDSPSRRRYSASG